MKQRRVLALLAAVALSAAGFALWTGNTSLVVVFLIAAVFWLVERRRY